jgi:hypothetical protein
MLLVGNIKALGVRFLGGWRGPWLLDCDLDLASDQTMPSGSVVCTVGTSKLKGTVDPRASGRFGEKAKARIVAGRGAWGSKVTKRDFHNDAPRGITSADVLASSASEIGETINDPSPVSFGTYYERLEGRASRELDGRDWYVDANGITQVAQWPAVKLGADALVMTYDPEERVAKLTADEIVWPGTVITDARFGTITVRDVDQRFTRDGSRVDVYHNTATVGRLDTALELLITELAGTRELKQYEYRVQKTNPDGRLQLAAALKVDGVPDMLPIPVWAGIPGVSVSFAGSQVGTSVRVVFLGGDKTRPLVVGFDGKPATTLTIDIASLLTLGKNASSFVALATATNGNFDALNNLLTGAGIPVVGGGGGTAKLASPISFGNVAATKVKAE